MPKKSSRILSALVDFLILTISSLIVFFTIALPLSLDTEAYNNNQKEIINIHDESGLFLIDKETGIMQEKSRYSGLFRSIDDFNDVTLRMEDKPYQHQNLSKDLYTFYTEKNTAFDGTANLSNEVFEKDILKVGSKDSNILSYDYNNYKIKMIDNDKFQVTLGHFLREYSKAAAKVSTCTRVAALQTVNDTAMLKSISLIIPIVFGFGLVFNLIIPLCNKDNRTIGKFIFKMSVVSKDGFELKKWRLIIRFLAYIFIEYILGFITFGGSFLISYTTFLFSKNRRSVHDFIAGTAVCDTNRSIIFKNAVEEKYYSDRGGLSKDEQIG